MEKQKVYFLTPAYDGTVHVLTVKSVMGAMAILSQAGIGSAWDFWGSCCYLPVVRNKLIRMFLESDATDMIFVDSDVEFEPIAALKLIQHDRDIISGLYPYKNDSGEYPVWTKLDEQGNWLIDKDTGLIEVLGVPAGLMRIKRGVFEKLLGYFGEETYLITEPDPKTGIERERYFNFFDCAKLGTLWRGEDYRFCEMWTAIGGRIWVEPDINITHHGLKGFAGNYTQYLKSQKDITLKVIDDGNKPMIPPQCVLGEFPSTNHPYPGNKIYGWMSLRELRWLYDRAGEMDSIAEIGTFNGRSTHALASGSKNTVQLYCIDPWLSMEKEYSFEDDTNEKASKRYNDFLERTKAMPGVAQRLTVYRESSIAASTRFEDKSVDMIFIDGDHSYQSVINDIEAWLPIAKKIICGHDYSPGWPEVMKAVNEKFGDKVKSLDTIWWIDLENN